LCACFFLLLADLIKHKTDKYASRGEEEMSNKEKSIITYLRESLLSVNRGSEAARDRMPVCIEICKNKVEAALWGSETIAAIYPQIKASSATAPSTIQGPSRAVSMPMPRYVQTRMPMCSLTF
jgi:hypothetical protein